MLTILLSIIFSEALAFKDFTLAGLLFWLNYHPFIAIITLMNVIIDSFTFTVLMFMVMIGTSNFAEQMLTFGENDKNV